MLNILNILNQIPEKTYKDFILFLQSPYHNSNKQLVKLITFRQKNITDLKIMNSKLLKKKTYNEQVTRNLLSELNKKFQKFLIISQLEKETTLGEVLLVKKMKSIGLEHQLEKWTSKINAKENKLKSIPTLQLEEHLFSDRMELLGRTDDQLIKEAIQEEYLSRNERAHISMINFYCIYLAVKKRHPNFIEIEVIEKEIKKLKISPTFKNAILMELYHQAFSLLKRPTKIKFINLHKKLYEKIDQIHLDYVRFILRVLLNYSINQNSANDLTLTSKTYEYLKSLISFTENEIIPFYQIINFVTVGCRLKKYSEVSKILERHQTRIENSAYAYSKALLNYYNGKIDKTIDLLSDTNFTNIKVNINARSLLIEVYIKKKEYQLALSNIEALRIYVLRSKKILSHLKKGRLNYLRFLKSFILLQENKNTLTPMAHQKAKATLSSKIVNCKTLIMRQYLMELLDQEK